MEQSADGIVSEWLKNLGLGKYTTAFYDNGYDELELCKQIGEDDLNAIGVFNPLHRKILLDSVMTLRCEGATGVYFTLEDVNRSYRQGKTNGKTAAVREQIYDVSPRSKLNPCPPHVNHPAIDNSQHNVQHLTDLVSKKMADEGVQMTSAPYMQQVVTCHIFTIAPLHLVDYHSKLISCLTRKLLGLP